MKKPFFDHLKELNTRILFSLLLILIFGIYVYIEYHFFVEILNKPLIDAGYDQSNIFALTIYEGFQVKITNVFLISLILLLPLTLLNLGVFLKPALVDLSWLSFIFYNIFFTIFYLEKIGILEKVFLKNGTMENFRITKAVAIMLKELARNNRPAVRPEVYLEELIEDTYRTRFRK